VYAPSGEAREVEILKEGNHITALPMEHQDPNPKSKLFKHSSAPVFADIFAEQSRIVFLLRVHPSEDSGARL
jgi:hypothetical protein